MIANKLCHTIVLGSALAFAACGGEGLTLPAEGEPADIAVVHGDGQSGRAGSILADSVVVRVTDTRDRPVADASVNFTFTDDKAAAVPATATTNADGVAWARVTLGAQVGQVAGVAEVPLDPGITPVRAGFTATILPGDANGIALVSGDAQSAPVNSELPAPLVVQVTDESGNPISGVTIAWSVTGGGSVSQASTVTGADGHASVTRILGPTAGQQTALATAEGLAGSPVTFTHIATAGTAAGVTKVSGDNQSALAGTELTDPLVVQVLDEQQNPIPNRAVTWIVTGGGGSVSAENTTTDAQGQTSTRWTLGPAAGPNSVNAVVSGVGTATFNAIGTAGTPSAVNSTVSASPTTITAGPGTSTVTVTVRDGGNNPVAGVSVSLASSGTGNTISPPSSTAGNGVATFTFGSTVAEVKTLTATAGGVVITDQATVTVNKASSTVEITSDDPDPSTVNQSVHVEFTASSNAGTPTGNVTVTVSNGTPTETCTGALTGGSGSCDIVLTLPGTGSGNRRVLTATYTGDAQFSGDTDTENHRVDPLPNSAPIAQNDSYNGTEDTPLSVSAGNGVLQNDSDPEGGPLTAVQPSDPPHGALTLNADGSFTYTPDPNFAGTDQFTYRARDEAGATTAATVTIQVAAVNDAPVATDDPFYVTTMDTPLSVPPDGLALVVNDDDVDDGVDNLTVTTGTFPTSEGGSVDITAGDGSFTYTPLSGFVGQDTFTYEVKDPSGASDTGTAIITVNAPPI